MPTLRFHLPRSVMLVAALSLSLVALAPVDAADTVTIVADGQPRASLIVRGDADSKDLQLAAQELQTHIARISGATLPMGGADGALAVVLQTVDPTQPADDELGADEAAFRIRIDATGIELTGRTARGTLYAAYELLERLGVRWYMPGELGTVTPSAATLRFDHGTSYQSPSFRSRYLTAGLGSPWAARVRLGGEMFPPAHGIKLLPKRTREKDPELFALVNGERRGSQLCVSNPAAIERAAAFAIDYFNRRPGVNWIGMGPNDGGGFCECADCRALDVEGYWDPYASHAVTTDRYIWFFNQVLTRIHQEHPGKKICFYAYHTYALPPRKHLPDQHIVPALAPISLCRIHGMSNPICPDRRYYETLMTDWGQLVPELFERGYYFNLACPDLPFSKVHAVRDEIPRAHALGVTGWKVEALPSWGTHTPTLYIAAKLMWDAEADVDAMLADFYTRFFGPAAAPMQRYLELVDHGFRDTDTHTGGSFCMPRVFTADRLASGQAALDQAIAATAADSVYRRRIDMYALNFQELQAFIGMLQARDRFDFAEAREQLQRMSSLNESLTQFDINALAPGATPDATETPKRATIPAKYGRTSNAYIRRFWTKPVESGYDRTVTRGELVAGLPDQWRFLQDPADVGEAAGWYADDLAGGTWQTLRTTSASWSDQGLHYYKGTGWYRADATVAERYRGRQIYLWFGGVDEAATVWLNGQKLGATDDAGEGLPGVAGTFLPFEFNVTEHIRFDAPNTIVVKVVNKRLDEVGTGGIVAPVMLWSPRDAAD